MNRLQNEMRLQAMRAMGGMAICRIGIVDAYDPNAYAVKVKFQPDETISGWLPIKSLWAGNGFGIQAGPQPGIEAWVVFQEGEHEAGIVVAFGFNDVERPLPVPAGEAWITHASGSYFKFLNSGHIAGKGTLDWQGDINQTGNFNQTGNLTQTGNTTTSGTVAATGNISSSADINDAHGSVSALRNAYDSHYHSDAQGGNTGTPSSTV